MAGTSVACNHQFNMRASVNVQHSNREGTCKHKSSWQDADEAMLGNAASFGRGVRTDDGHNTGEILSKPHWQSHQSATKVARSAGGELMPESCAVVTSQLSKSQEADIHQKSGHPGVKRTIAARKNCPAMEAVYWYNVTPKDNLSSMSLADMLQRCHILVRHIDATLPPESQINGRRYKKGDIV